MPSVAVTWVTFHSAYDFGYLVKLLIGRKLPRTLPEFLGLVRVFFGEGVYDIRHVMTRCGGLYGGLDRVAASLGVERAAGRSHQAGSDSALTWDASRRIREVYFPNQSVRGFAGVLFGLELELETDLAAVAPSATSKKRRGGKTEQLEQSERNRAEEEKQFFVMQVAAARSRGRHRASATHPLLCPTNRLNVNIVQILLVLRNLETNLTAPQFEPVRRLLSRYDLARGLSGQL